ncbi:MAG: DUF2156 domain-containing protein [Treponema sp.]|nr:DUF2156 domain-containing protein [Candidatus Treponema equifaecale]
MNWSVPCFDDVKKFSLLLNDPSLEGSDCSLANLFLYQKQYDTRICAENGFLFRFYTGNESRGGYGFPIHLKNSVSTLLDAIKLILEDAEKNGRPVKFCMITKNQKNQLEECALKNFPDFHFEWNTNRDDCDYIYGRKNLAELAGKTYHKKKNHVSKFLRTFEGNWEFRLLSLCNVSDDIVRVSEKWLQERLNAGIADDRKILEMELESIKTAVEHKSDFEIEGGVLYTSGKPVAMTLASKISDTVLDVNYEKCLGEAAQNGGYAAINWCFANAAEKFDFFNREEDMGVEGLRKAKLSYHPQKILDKYFGEMHQRW